jgi:hypothetical protein
MAHTFDIRFARSAGLAALLEAPTNSFRWTGTGSLSIDAQGISVAARRGLLSLLARNRTRRIPTANLKEVFREGDALRVEFATEETARASLLFWAQDRETAAQIVQLLPTTRTVELEHSTNPRQQKFHSNARVWMFVAVAALLAAVTGWQKFRAPVTPAAALAERPAFEVPTVSVPLLPDLGTAPITSGTPLERDGVEPFIVEVPMPPLRMPQLPLDDVVPIQVGTPAYPIARRQLRTFGTEASQLWADYRVERDLLAARTLTADKFADHLRELELGWWNVTFRILDSRELDAPELLDVRAALLGAARHWRGFLDGYAAGIRAGDSVAIAASFDELAVAEEQQARARRYLD